MIEADKNPMPEIKILSFECLKVSSLSRIANAVGGFVLNRHEVPTIDETPNTGAAEFLDAQLFDADIAGWGIDVRE